jgi:tetratricopeptide (TPR) repeat protein
VDDLLQQGIAALKAGDNAGARKFLIAATKQNPNDEVGWGWLYRVSKTDAEKRYCLEQIIRINPENKKAAELLSELIREDPLDFDTPKLKDSEPASSNIAVALPAEANTAIKKCPYCAEIVQADAQVCKHCGKNIIPSIVVAEKLNTLGSSITALGCSIFVLLILGICFYSIFFSK